MDATRSLVISLHLYHYDGSNQRTNADGTPNPSGIYGGFPHPRDIPDPPKITQQTWIPQTVGDSIWKLYEFETVEARDAFIVELPEVYAEASLWTDNQAFFDHWTGRELSVSATWAHQLVPNRWEKETAG